MRAVWMIRTFLRSIQHSKHVLSNHRGYRNILVLIDPNKPGALDGAFFEEQQNQAPYAPFLP